MTWVCADEAAVMLGASIQAVHVIAHRDRWRRIRVGHRVAYAIADVDDTRERRLQNRVTRV